MVRVFWHMFGGFCIGFFKGAVVLEGFYPVYFGAQAVGKVQVLREGLYYRFHCRCRLSGEVVCRLYVTCGEKQESLGVVVPMEDGFGLDTRLAVKHLGNEEPRFTLGPRREKQEKKLVPISPEEPFAYLSRLKDAYLAYQDGVAMAVIPAEAGDEGWT